MQNSIQPHIIRQNCTENHFTVRHSRLALEFRGKMGKEKLLTFFSVVVIDFFPSTFRTIFTFIYSASKFHFIRVKLSLKNQTPIEWTIFHLPNENLLQKKIRFSDLFTLLSLCLFDDAKPLSIKKISIHSDRSRRRLCTQLSTQMTTTTQSNALL